MRLLKIMFALIVICPEILMAHGYVEEPASRSYKCSQKANTQCGPIEYEPQSVEGPDGFPSGGAPDGQIAGAATEKWGQLNEQTSTRWNRNSISAGSRAFRWHFTMPHATKEFRYYITKSNWNPNLPLTRNSFELNPFCLVPRGMAVPPANDTHVRIVPQRQGYHVILATWDVGDTDKTFYQAIDVDFSGANPTPSSTKPSTKTPLPTTPSSTESLPTTPTPTSCGGGATPSAGKCRAISNQTTDSWCQTNCNHNPVNCPTYLCSCDGLNSTPSSSTPSSSTAPNPTAGMKECHALPGSGADDSWCQLNCNHNPSFCPANFCGCR